MEPDPESAAPWALIPGSAAVNLVLGNSPDDWSGVTSTAERRRRQNRLNQRAWRQRRRREPGNTSHLPPASIDGDGSVQPVAEADRGQVPPKDNRSISLGQGYLFLPTAERRARARQVASSLYSDYSSGTPRPAYLPILTRLNALEALASNAAALGFRIDRLCCDELISPFNKEGPSLPWAGEISASCPASLLPTATQKHIIHHPWIDLIPFPGLRDAALLAMAAGALDDDELAADLLSVEDGRGEDAGLIVWHGSWDPRAWEATAPFLRKWGWLMSDCRELCVATNDWRDRRGERRFKF